MNITKKSIKTTALTLLASLTMFSAVPATVMAHDKRDDKSRGWGYGHLIGRHGKYWQLCKTNKVWFGNRLHHKFWTVESFQDRYDKILDRLDTFVTDNNLVVENADVLKANISTASDAVIADLNELKAIKDSVDCDDSESVEANTEAYRAKLLETKESLKAYREALRTYKHAIHEAAEAVNGEETSESSN